MSHDIKIISSGLLTTIQDLGRYGYRSHGIPISGAMDQSSAKLANLLVGNDENDALLECTMMGPKIEFHCDTYIAVTGAEVDIFLDDILQILNTTISIKTGNILNFGKVHRGCRFYISFASGLNTLNILESRSTDTVSEIGLPILKRGQYLDLFQNNLGRFIVNLSRLKDTLTPRKIKVYPGPEYHVIEYMDLPKISFTIDPSSNRMSYILKVNFDVSHSQEMISSAVLPGTIQLTPGGQFNALMRDAQTTGGYPRVMQIDEDDLDYLAQCRGGQSISFELVSYSI